MAHTDTLIETLKQALKANGLTYADIARSLNWSEASVKRWFANGNMTVQRLEAICELIGMEMIDLVRMLDETGTVSRTLHWSRKRNWSQTPGCCWWRCVSMVTCALRISSATMIFRRPSASICSPVSTS